MERGTAGSSHHAIRSALGLLALAAALAAMPVSASDSGHFPPWEGQESLIETALLEGKVLEIEKLSRGVTQPYRVVLEHEGRKLAGVWKPIDPSAHKYAESFLSEIAAYRLNRLLGMNRVPPTVRRKIGGDWGSLQYWVEGVSLYDEVKDSLPRTVEFSHDMARMRMFDRVISNPDRNAGNFLVDAQGRIILIDHSRALAFDGHARSKKKITPTLIDRTLLEQLASLDLDSLAQALHGLVPRYRVKALLKERDRLQRDVDKVVAQRGDGIFFD